MPSRGVSFCSHCCRRGQVQGARLGMGHGVKIPQGGGIFRPGAANGDGHETS